MNVGVVAAWLVLAAFASEIVLAVVTVAAYAVRDGIRGKSPDEVAGGACARLSSLALRWITRLMIVQYVLANVVAAWVVSR